MTWPESPCAACPRGELGGCKAQALRNARLCELAASGREDYRALLSLPAGEAPAVAAPDVPLAESLAITRALHTCPWRDPVPECGCSGMARCAIGVGDRGGDVSHADCWECCRAEIAVRVSAIADIGAT